MDWIEIVGLVAAAFAAGFWIGRTTGHAKAPPPAPTPPPADKLREIRRVLARGEKIEAIRMYREHTGAGLKEAKDAVDRLVEVTDAIGPPDRV
jgi:ribosomal protein L7/L12